MKANSIIGTIHQLNHRHSAMARCTFTLRQTVLFKQQLISE